MSGLGGQTLAHRERKKKKRREKKMNKRLLNRLLLLARAEIQLGAKHIPAASKFDQERERKIENIYIYIYL